VVVGCASTIYGAGISNAGSLQIERCTIRDNKITGLTTGGGRTAVGGGIDNSGSMTITNSTISGNRVFAGGGGIRNRGTAYISFSTITKNVANLGAPDEALNRTTGGGILNFGFIDMNGTINFGIIVRSGTILAGNIDNRTKSDTRYSPDCYSRTDAYGVFESYGGNLDGIINENCNNLDRGVGQAGTKDNPLDPGLFPLSNWGGPTMTHALRSDSRAIDRGGIGIGFHLGFDQRGEWRQQGFDVDAGAFESPFTSSAFYWPRSVRWSPWVIIIRNDFEMPNIAALNR
jgi:hypothetical protein